jgi:hypothetical protein
MAMPEPLEPSRRFRSAAAAERARLGRELARLDDRVGLLGQELEQIQARRDAIRKRLSLLVRVAHTGADGGEAEPVVALADTPPPRRVAAAEPAHLLRGAQIREAAVQLLVRSGSTRRALHYQEWLGLLEREGLSVAGKDPAATFLTQISRSPVLRRIGAPGFYALDAEAPDRLRGQVRELRAELARPEEPDATPEEVAAQRDRRVRLTSRLARTERELEEALRVLEVQA